MVFVRDCLLSTEIKVDNMSTDIQAIPSELNIRKQKWLLLPIYRPPNQNMSFFVEQIFKLIDKLGRYDNVLVLGDFNMEPNDKNLSPLLAEHNLYNLIKGPTCFKSCQGRCIGLLLTNKKHSVMMTQSFETGFSDHHHLIYTVLKSTYNKAPPKKLLYRDYKNWSEDRWKMDLERNLRASHPASYSEFESVFMTSLEENAPLKTKIVRANNKPHVTKELRKAIMVRTTQKGCK